MSDEAALLAAILAHPDEDTPRLMYADWLEEHGQPERAEFIRIQCDPTADEAAEGCAAELEERQRVKWLAGLPQFPGSWWEFRRGLPEFLGASGELFLERYEAFARAPWLRFLSLFDVNNARTRDFVNRPWNPRWVGLELEEDPVAAAFASSYDCTPAIAAVARSPQVQQIRWLQLVGFRLTPQAIAELSASQFLSNLERLLLDGNRDDPRFAPLRERFGDRLMIG